MKQGCVKCDVNVGSRPPFKMLIGGVKEEEEEEDEEEEEEEEEESFLAAKSLLEVEVEVEVANASCPRVLNT
jgi:hypothetical protein